MASKKRKQRINQAARIQKCKPKVLSFQTRDRKERGHTPYFYVKGTLSGISSFSQEQLIGLLKKAGLKFSTPKDEIQTTRNVRTAVRNAVSKLKEGHKKQGFFVATTTAGKLFLTISKHGEQCVIRQFPVLHGVTASTGSILSFNVIKKILKNGFMGSNPPNVTVESRGKMGHFAENIKSSTEKLELYGDSFALELMAPMSLDAEKYSFVSFADASQILRVNIKLRKNGPSSFEEKKRFYLENITKKYGIKIKFV